MQRVNNINTITGNNNKKKMLNINLKMLKKNSVFKRYNNNNNNNNNNKRRVSTHKSVDLPPFSGTFDSGCVTSYNRSWRGGLNH